MATEHIDTYLSPTSWTDHSMNWTTPNAQEASYIDALWRAYLERSAVIKTFYAPAYSIPNPDRRLRIEILQDLYTAMGYMIYYFVNPNKPATSPGYYQLWTLAEAINYLYPSSPVYPYPQIYFRDNSSFAKVAHDLLNLMVCTRSDLEAVISASDTTSNDRDWINAQAPDYVDWGRGGFDNNQNNLSVNLTVTGVMLQGTPNSCQTRVWNGVGPDPGYTDARSGFSVTVPPGYTLNGIIDSTNLPGGHIIQQTYSPSAGPTGWQSTWITTGAGGADYVSSVSAVPSANSDGTTFTGHAATLNLTGSTSYPSNMAPLKMAVQIYISGTGPDGFTVPGYGWTLNAWNTIGVITITPSEGSPQSLSYSMDIQPSEDVSSTYNWSVGGVQFVSDFTSWTTLNPHGFQFHP